MSGLNIDSVFNSMMSGIDEQSQKVSDMVANADVSDMTQMMKLQMEESKYELAIKIGSTLTSDLKNAISAIAQKS
ncbi:MAG: hypothetical protein OXE42_14455 [Gammaproteobacteria bacterium]|nr:hypothetical protein [Gammaproteobacteria bacterium]